MSSLTARQIVQLIQENLGLPTRSETVDTFKSGDPDAIVTGVAVTMMPTLEVLQRAVELGANFIIAHEPTFYGHLDDTSQLEQENDVVWQAKVDFLEANQLILWRFHDAPHWVEPDMILDGMVEELGWRSFQNPDDAQLFHLPSTSLAALARQLRGQLAIRTLRVVGDPNLPVSQVALSPGCPGFTTHRHLLQNQNVEVLVIGEAFEWETIAYVADAAGAGLPKALIVLGHIPSEQGGMRGCARWLEQFLPTPVTFIPTPEPFWSPE